MAGLNACGEFAGGDVDPRGEQPQVVRVSAGSPQIRLGLGPRPVTASASTSPNIQPTEPAPHRPPRRRRCDSDGPGRGRRSDRPRSRRSLTSGVGRRARAQAAVRDHQCRRVKVVAVPHQREQRTARLQPRARTAVPNPAAPLGISRLGGRRVNPSTLWCCGGERQRGLDASRARVGNVATRLHLQYDSCRGRGVAPSSDVLWSPMYPVASSSRLSRMHALIHQGRQAGGILCWAASAAPVARSVRCCESTTT